jgi:hypothetical protein
MMRGRHPAPATTRGRDRGRGMGRHQVTTLAGATPCLVAQAVWLVAPVRSRSRSGVGVGVQGGITPTGKVQVTRRATATARARSGLRAVLAATGMVGNRRW